MCEMSQLVLGGMAKGHELIQQLLHGSRVGHSLPLYYIILLVMITIIISDDHNIHSNIIIT